MTGPKGRPLFSRALDGREKQELSVGHVHQLAPRGSPSGFGVNLHQGVNKRHLTGISLSPHVTHPPVAPHDLSRSHNLALSHMHRQHTNCDPLTLSRMCNHHHEGAVPLRFPLKHVQSSGIHSLTLIFCTRPRLGSTLSPVRKWNQCFCQMMSHASSTSRVVNALSDEDSDCHTVNNVVNRIAFLCQRQLLHEARELLLDARGRAASVNPDLDEDWCEEEESKANVQTSGDSTCRAGGREGDRRDEREEYDDLREDGKIVVLLRGVRVDFAERRRLPRQRQGQVSARRASRVKKYEREG